MLYIWDICYRIVGMNYIFINEKGYDIETSCCKAVSSIDEYGDRYCKKCYDYVEPKLMGEK